MLHLAKPGALERPHIHSHTPPPVPGSYLLLRSLQPARPRGGPRGQSQMSCQFPRQAPCLAVTCNLQPPAWRGGGPSPSQRGLEPSVRRDSVCRDNRGAMRREQGNLEGPHGGGSRRTMGKWRSQRWKRWGYRTTGEGHRVTRVERKCQASTTD